MLDSNKLSQDLFAVFVIALISSSTVLAQEAKCSDDYRLCTLEWTYSVDPKLRYDVEQLDPVSASWRKIATSSMAIAGKAFVEGGRLYRVVGCDQDKVGNATGCASSNIVWAPVYPDEEAIPKTVTGFYGETMSIDKNLDLNSQTEQYNVYIFVKMLDSLGSKILDLPDMRKFTDADAWADAHYSLSDSIEMAVAVNYAAKRERLINNVRTTGPQRR